MYRNYLALLRDMLTILCFWTIGTWCGYQILCSLFPNL